MMSRTIHFVSVALLVTGAGAIGCKPAPGPEGPSGGPSESDRADAVIGVSVLTFTNPFFIELSDAIKEEAARHNYRAIVVAGEMDPEKQAQQVEDFITKQVDAIILCPCDSRAVGASIAKANNASIPVFTCDIASMSDQGNVVCHVATDNFGGGRAAAQAVVEMLGGKGKVAILNHPRIESAIMREQGFNEEIGKTPQIEVAAILPGGGERQMSSEATKDLLQTHSDLNGIFAINDPSALGAAQALAEVGLADRIRIVGFDAQPPAKKAVQQGQLYATIVQYPKKIGRTVAQKVHDHLVGKEVEPEILIPVTIYRKADADADPSLKETEE
jgi:ribose transport system substrate-binding protein